MEGALLNEIFSHIPEICTLHEKFLQEIRERVERWHHMQKIGDILVNTVCWSPVHLAPCFFSNVGKSVFLQFTRCQLMELYSAFIQNFMRAKTAVEIAKHSRPDFSRLLEVGRACTSM